MSRTTWLRNWKRSLDRRWALHQALRNEFAARRRGVRPRLEVLEDRCLLSAYVVTTTADSGAGSLRAAIGAVNGGLDNEIDFNIGTVGSAQTISPVTQLPTLTANNVYINGLSQGGSGNTTPLITLNGTSTVNSTSGVTTADGLLVSGSYCTVSGLIIEAFSGDGIFVDQNADDNTIGGTAAGAGNVLSGNDEGLLILGSGTQVMGNYIGTNVAGSAAFANTSEGILIGGGSNDTIGGTTAGARNILSGNGDAGLYTAVGISGVVVQGNYIGTDVTGSSAVANTGDGVFLQGPSTVGGTVAGARNIISGNGNYGVASTDQYGTPILIEGNYIGTDVTGDSAISNGQGGINFWGAGNNTVGGTVSGARNLISGNTNGSGYGILIQAGGSDLVLGNYIGTNAAGTAALSNNVGIEAEANGNTIGGTVSGAGNVISGNSGDGMQLDIPHQSQSTGNLVLGNYIGTDYTGSNALANSGNGIELAYYNTVGGTTSAARNVISGNSGDGVKIDYIGSGTSGTVVLGNYIGTNAAGTAALPNSVGIVDTSGANTIGGTASGAGNVISGNTGDGVLLQTAGFFDTLGDLIDGNYIGLNLSGSALGNGGNGIRISDSNSWASNNTIGGSVAGASNTIANNSGDGVLITAGRANTLSANSIYANGSSGTGPGIILNPGANNNVPAPILSSATLSGTTLTVTGTYNPSAVNTTPVYNYVLEFFASPSGDAEGKIFLGSEVETPTTTGTQSFTTFTTTTTVTGTNPLITATLTDYAFNTSEFSNGVLDPVISSPPIGNVPTSSSLPSPTSSITPTPTPFELVLEIALDTAALLLQSNPQALVQLEGFSVMFLGQSLPPGSELFSSILIDMSALDSAFLM